MSAIVPRLIPVDNAAQIFVSINSKKETTMSRIALSLKQPIDKNQLNEALKRIIKVFPFFQVYLKKQFFNYIFERTEDLPIIENDTKWTNRYINFNENKFPFRIKVHDNSIALELSHILSDGYGTLSFLLSLTAEYLRISNYDIGESVLIKKPGDDTTDEEWECAFRNIFPKKGPALKMNPPAYIPKAEMISVDKYYSTRIIMNLDEVRKKARKGNATLNVYMAAIYAFVLQDMFLEDIADGKEKSKLPIRLQIPVNLRKDYPTRSLRNFSYLYSPSFNITNGAYSFQELIENISMDIRHERHSESIKNQISRNLRAESNLLFRILPRAVKQLLFRVFYHLFARSQYSGVLTNMGDIKLPPQMEEAIVSFDIIPCNSPVPGRNTALFSYKGKLEMNIGSSCDNLRLENKIMEQLKKLSIDYEVVYKRDGLY
ncbi:MAG: hypothetical protein PF693_05665 [Spirochaetia bacterium]|jgi:NRPS condensation-like uncharacterized protein|nr:hypothetical protein [Spirochaetia bacterium]